MKKILIINTSVDKYKNRNIETGLWLGELVHFYDKFKNEDVKMDIYSINGGEIPIDPISIGKMMLDKTTRQYMQDDQFMHLLKTSKPLNNVDDKSYDAVYFTGGHGVMFDFAQNDEIARIIHAMDQDGKIIAAVCHGVAALLNFEDHRLQGTRMTGFSNVEERLAGKTKVVPFLLENELKGRKVNYSRSIVPFVSHVVADDNIITGQNPQSPAAVGEAVRKMLFHK